MISKSKKYQSGVNSELSVNPPYIDKTNNENGRSTVGISISRHHRLILLMRTITGFDCLTLTNGLSLLRGGSVLPSPSTGLVTRERMLLTVLLVSCLSLQFSEALFGTPVSLKAQMYFTKMLCVELHL